MEKINKMIEAYNKKAVKWGYDLICVINDKLNEPFIEKSTEGMSFFKKIKTTFQNGYMKEDYEKIKKELY